jgi:NitT/TauT family transport system ATP-binding protein/sulfonate transport system ATP-binding protein
MILENVRRLSYPKVGDPHHVVDKVSLEVRNNEFLVLLGPGHCGKTVLLNIVAGYAP